MILCWYGGLCVVWIEVGYDGDIPVSTRRDLAGIDSYETGVPATRTSGTGMII